MTPIVLVLGVLLVTAIGCSRADAPNPTARSTPSTETKQTQGSPSSQERPFEYQGIKSGMSKSEVRKSLDLDAVAGALKAKYGLGETIDAIVADIFRSGLHAETVKRLKGKDFRLVFFFTDQDLLWRLDVYVDKPADPARQLALDKAVRSRFKDYLIAEESSTSRYGTTYFYRATMIDSALLKPAVERYTAQYMEKM
jgi:hypothetical protein